MMSVRHFDELCKEGYLMRDAAAIATAHMQYSEHDYWWGRQLWICAAYEAYWSSTLRNPFWED